MKKVLFVGEFTPLSTGYSVYWREVMKRIASTCKYEIAEMASYAHPEDNRTKSLPWKVYPVVPPQNRPDLMERFQQDPAANFGGQIFEEVVLDFQATHILGVRDWWMDSFIDTSPYRQFYNWIQMPTVDAVCQNKEWLDTYSRVDILLTYTDWSKEVLEREANLKVKCSASPAAPAIFVPPKDKKLAKQEIGINPDKFIVGMVARNQRRKLFPDLFNAFRKFLDISQRNDVILYVHTSYPDVGWPIEQLILEYNLSPYVYLTYICQCGNIFSAPFAGCKIPCSRCSLYAEPASVRKGVSDEALCKVYQAMDLYCQIANSEGMGMPQVEAAACGVPLMATDYAAMSDVLTRLNGIRIKPVRLTKELESGCFRAAPDIEQIAHELKLFFSLPEQIRARKSYEVRAAYDAYYSYDKVANIWMECIDELPIRGGLQTTTPRVFPVPEYKELNCTDAQYIRYLLSDVLQDPTKFNSYYEMDLIQKLRMGHLRSVGQRQIAPFGRHEAYQTVANQAKKRNFYESLRDKKFKITG